MVLSPELAAHAIRLDDGGGARFVEGAGGPILEVNTEQCTAEVSVLGAQVLRWAPAGQQPALFVSPKAVFAPNKAIRGGVPISFPWFANRVDDPKPDGKPSPNHGFVRAKPWDVETVRLEENGRLRVVMTTRDDVTTRALWDHAFQLSCIMTIGTTLTVALEVKNTGASEFTFEEALHTYFAVADSARVRVVGLEPGRFIDKPDDRKVKQHDGAPLAFNGEVDAVFLASKAAVVIDDEPLGRHIRVEKTGSAVTVVWNPGMVLAQTIADIGGEAWRSFVCVEAANSIPHAVALPPGATHTITQRMSIVPQHRR